MTIESVTADQIPIDEINFHPTSFCDSGGRLFRWRGGLYRGITNENARFTQRLFQERIVERLVEKNFLIDTELTELNLAGYPLVLKHRTVPFVSYASEWCGSMLKDAGLFIADMALDLAQDGLIVDADTWDLLFDGVQPVYVDFCSIEESGPDNRDRWQLFADDFRSYFTYPVELTAQGHGRLARWLLSDYYHDEIHAQFAALLGRDIYGFAANQNTHKLSANGKLGNYKPVTERIARPFMRRGSIIIESTLARLAPSKSTDRFRSIEGLRSELKNISLPMANAGAKGTIEGTQIQPDARSTKEKVVFEMLSELKPSTVLDVGCGQGHFARMAASLGSVVVAIDDDERHVEACYHLAKADELSILPLVMNIARPTQGDGIDGHGLTAALKRLPCDMVLALDIVHLLVFESYLSLEQISRILTALTHKWLLVEFVNLGDRAVQELSVESPEWYTLENFCSVLEKCYRQVRTIPIESDTRVMVLCE